MIVRLTPRSSPPRPAVWPKVPFTAARAALGDVSVCGSRIVHSPTARPLPPPLGSPLRTRFITLADQPKKEHSRQRITLALCLLGKLEHLGPKLASRTRSDTAAAAAATSLWARACESSGASESNSDRVATMLQIPKLDSKTNQSSLRLCSVLQPCRPVAAVGRAGQPAGRLASDATLARPALALHRRVSSPRSCPCRPGRADQPTFVSLQRRRHQTGQVTSEHSGRRQLNADTM
jgi:hypothetical protein